MGSLTLRVFILALWVKLYSSQVSWTPIFVDEKSIVDLWTSKATGCACPFNKTRSDCACCTDGGCHCGVASPHRCAQCGIQQYCTNMCNVTIDASTIATKSNKTYGQIKSPSLEGPGTCWYLLRPDVGQRVEIQVHRILNIGRFNGTSCQFGVLQFMDGEDPTALGTSKGIQLCGENERYAQPVVLFADKSPATLIFRIEESTIRSQFLAYFSFTSNTSPQGVKFQPKGGRRMPNTDCDWLYQDIGCHDCLLATPGYPGVYPSYITCQYHLTTTSISTKIRIKFLSLKLPHNHCSSHHINVYQGSSNTSNLLMTICSDKDEELVFTGPHLLFEFKGGPSIPPYDYKGFLASISFLKRATVAPATETTLALTTELPFTAKAENPNSASNVGCEIQIHANDSRTGHFNSRPLELLRNCFINFIGNPNDIVHLSVFNFKLKAPNCQSYLELYDGPVGASKPIKRICSPHTKHARDANGKFHSHETLVSSGNTFSILFHRLLTESNSDLEHVDGAYTFHDEQKDGTLAPDTLCNTDHYAASSLPQGQITNPGNQQIYWNIEGRMQCSHRFIPAFNQSISLKITSLKLSNEPRCQTECGDAGCRCNTDSVTLSNVDHILFMHDTGGEISCLCGNFHEDWLPVSIRSWSPLKLVYSVAHYSWTAQGFNYKTDYSFNLDGACGHHVISNYSGSLHSTRIVGGGELNYYYHQVCSWTLDSTVERQLTLEIATSQNRPCTAWNFTLYEYSESSSDHLGPVIHVFCPRDKHKVYNLAWKLNVIVIKLTAMTRTLPQYFIKWQSQIVRANTRISGQTSSILSSPSSSSALPTTNLKNSSPFLITYVLVLIVNLLSFHSVHR